MTNFWQIRTSFVDSFDTYTERVCVRYIVRLCISEHSQILDHDEVGRPATAESDCMQAFIDPMDVQLSTLRRRSASNDRRRTTIALRWNPGWRELMSRPPAVVICFITAAAHIYRFIAAALSADACIFCSDTIMPH